MKCPMRQSRVSSRFVLNSHHPCRPCSSPAWSHCRRCANALSSPNDHLASAPPPNLFAPVLPLIVDWVADLEWKRNWKCHHPLIHHSPYRSPLFMSFSPRKVMACLASSTLSKTERRYLLSQCLGWLSSESCFFTSSPSASHFFVFSRRSLRFLAPSILLFINYQG